jgi:hypothetical protein
VPVAVDAGRDEVDEGDEAFVGRLRTIRVLTDD